MEINFQNRQSIQRLLRFPLPQRERGNTKTFCKIDFRVTTKYTLDFFLRIC